MARVLALDAWPGELKAQRYLWQVVEQLTPRHATKPYNQAMMDLGATVCTRARPRCDHCPLSTQCQAFKTDAVASYPVSKPKKAKPTKSTWLLMIENSAGAVWLEPRPATGIWGGLWSFPEFSSLAELYNQTSDLCSEWFEMADGFRHTFSHYHLEITPVRCELPNTDQRWLGAAQEGIWYDPQQPAAVGLAAPVLRLIKQRLETVEVNEVGVMGE